MLGIVVLCRESVVAVASGPASLRLLAALPSGFRVACGVCGPWAFGVALCSLCRVGKVPGCSCLLAALFLS